MNQIARCVLALSLTMCCGLTHAEATAATPTAARIGYVSLKVRDLERSLHFYETVMGLKQSRRLQASKDVVEVLLHAADASDASGVMLMHDARRDRPYELGDGYSRMVVYVDDLRRIVDALPASGGTTVRATTRVEALKISIMLARDPDGYLIEFVQRDQS
jgi:lactoylglutathione lyase